MIDFPSSTTALVIDDSLTVRQTVRTILAQLGIARAEACSNPGEARRKLQAQRFDIVLCDYHFGPGITGQELLEDLRRSQALPLSTVFIMITAEAKYEMVVAVAEIAPDDYLLKPFASRQLEERMARAWQKRAWLLPVYTEIESNRLHIAIELARDKLQHPQAIYRSETTRLLAELLVMAGRQDEATAIYQEILASKMVPWAKLGLAKMYQQAGRGAEAEAMMVSLLAENSLYVDAYDQLASHYAAEQQHEAALAVIERSLEVTPGNIARLQQAGITAFKLGAAEQARQHLEKAVAYGANSMVLEARTVFLLLISSYETGKAREADKLLKLLESVGQRRHSFEAEQRMLLAQAIVALAFGRHGEAEAKLDQVGAKLLDSAFKLELACDLIRCIAQLDPLPERQRAQVSQATLRFAVSRQAGEQLEAAAQHAQSCSALVRDGQTRINHLANQGMQLVVQQQLEQAADHLYQHARQTQNGRLLQAAATACLKWARQCGQERPLWAMLERSEQCARQLSWEQHDADSYRKLEHDLAQAKLALRQRDAYA